ncbi:MAG: crossover junction endodeoxyribonuclease RuvC [Proteobacteria bacterium]|nr:crossover junction endodeoxyribonuclease RuvC [Pseudomonadota bacterium]
MVKVIGVDPGLADTGIGIIMGTGLTVDSYSFGSISTHKDVSLPVRLDMIYSQLNQLLKQEAPDLMVVEDIFSLARNPKSGISLGKVTGAILLAGCHAAIPVIEIPVREAKKILSGNGNAGKEQLEKSVRYLLKHNSPIRPFHASDALALALIGLYRFDTHAFNDK